MQTTWLINPITTIEIFDKKAIPITETILPLASNAKQNATKFFKVPYFRVCFYMPAPLAELNMNRFGWRVR
ncbi:MAG: DUF3299 domain-containing protein [Pseudoalteromonas sp.]